MKICAFDTCDRPIKALGLCHAHYMQQRRGVPLHPVGVPRGGQRSPLSVRIELRKSIDPITGCWEWTGALDPKGYGRIQVDGRCGYVHRASWEVATGEPIPDGLVVDHVCENRRCFNPRHLELVTHRENTNRRNDAQASRTHCPAGHRYAGQNLRLHTDKRGYTRRICVTCQNIRNGARQGVASM